jgi:hypothetical protein
MRVLWMCGPSAVGKSSTAWEVFTLLTGRGERAAYVDIDQLKMVYPEPGPEADRERLGWTALGAIADVFSRFGAQTLAVSGVLDSASIPLYTNDQAPFPLAFVRLSVDDAELKRRLDARRRYAAPWMEALAEAQPYERAQPDHPVVVAAGRPPSEVAESVLDAASPTTCIGPFEDPRGDRRLPATAAKAVLISGTRAVGKSSVAWELFMELRRRGTTTAFLDLRQLGFLGPYGGAVNHDLQAASVESVWEVFRAAGAQSLILNGTVDSDAQLDQYRAAIGPATLEHFRLTAAGSALADRVRLRASGQSPARLAGDDLTGLAEDDAATLVGQALDAQNRKDGPMVGYTIDTTHLAAHRVARQILEQWGA